MARQKETDGRTAAPKIFAGCRRLPKHYLALAKTSMVSSSNNLQWSIEVPSTSRSPDHPSGGRGNIRRSCDPLASPVLGAFGVRTLYEALRRGRDINPLGPCLGFRATR